MVHALQSTRKLLKPRGILVNIHDLPAPCLVEVRTTHSSHKVGWLVDRQGFANVRAAFDALAQVVSERIYTLEDERQFAYRVYLDGLAELETWLAEWWSSAVLSDGITSQIREHEKGAGGAVTIMLDVQARVTQLSVSQS